MGRGELIDTDGTAGASGSRDAGGREWRRGARCLSTISLISAVVCSLRAVILRAASAWTFSISASIAASLVCIP
jgi:hypothetical protein